MAEVLLQKRQLTLISRWLFGASTSSFVLCGCLTCYFWEKSPTAADTTSGAVYPYYDKLHSNYIYLTAMQNNSLSVLICVGVVCIFGFVISDLKLRRLVTPSAEEGRQGEGLDKGDL
jgi:hypothetical protein